MGIYLNSSTAYTLYKNETKKPYFVDKTLMLEQIFPLVDEGTNYICIACPRHFGKTVMANMINGYHTASGEQVYDPCSVVQALRFNELSNY